ncbi:MAG: class I SAM-dependent methyltransferase [Candidatus Eisenbacteria bacterium]
MPDSDYASIARYYDSVRPAPDDVWINNIVTLGGIRPDSDVLDVGCGTGRFTLKTARLSAARLYALDSSEQMLKNAVQKDRQRIVHWLIGNAHRLPFRSQSLDCVFMTMVIHHIGPHEKLLREIRRSLRPSGRCLLVTTSHAAIRAHVLRLFPGVVGIDVKRFPAIASLRTAMRGAGFTKVRSHTVRHEQNEMPVQDYLDMVRSKYISTLSLLSERSFESGYRIFEKRLRSLYGKKMKRTLVFTFVVGER